MIKTGLRGYMEDIDELLPEKELNLPKFQKEFIRIIYIQKKCEKLPGILENSG